VTAQPGATPRKPRNRKSPEKPVEPPVCSYCKATTALKLTSDHLYGGRDFGPVWECAPCNAWVGCHKNSSKHAPLGTPANREVRELRKEAHAWFDPLWMSAMKVRGLKKGEARRNAYTWLATEMGQQTGHCHISWMQAEDLLRVINLLKAVKEKADARRLAQSE